MGKKKPLKTETRKKTGSKSPPRAAPRKAVTKKTAGSRPARPSKSAPSGTKAAPKGKKASSAGDGRSGKARKMGKMDGAAAIPAKASRAARSGGLDAGRSKETARAARKGAAASPAAKPTSFRRITSSELGRIRTLLSEMKHRTESLVQREASELRTLEKRHRADLEEMASDTHETDSHCHIMDIENIKIAEIDAALVKIENGTYGVCEDCSQEIPFVRLEALPFATQCIACKSRAERRGQISASASSSDSALS
ncbi:MAG TPA: TraR/DksA C4-type zinc finger protein [Planctomycetota bacterium]|nr:TraR/DksA C4-type zinc finger protein [Planctomycetota bacterium]